MRKEERKCRREREWEKIKEGERKCKREKE